MRKLNTDVLFKDKKSLSKFKPEETLVGTEIITAEDIYGINHKLSSKKNLTIEFNIGTLFTFDGYDEKTKEFFINHDNKKYTFSYEDHKLFTIKKISITKRNLRVFDFLNKLFVATKGKKSNWYSNYVVKDVLNWDFSKAKYSVSDTEYFNEAMIDGRKIIYLIKMEKINSFITIYEEESKLVLKEKMVIKSSNFLDAIKVSYANKKRKEQFLIQNDGWFKPLDQVIKSNVFEYITKGKYHKFTLNTAEEATLNNIKIGGGWNFFEDFGILVRNFNKYESPQKSVPSGPDTSKFTATVSGGIWLCENHTSYGGYYGINRHIQKGLNIGSGFDYGNPRILAKYIIALNQEKYKCRWSNDNDLPRLIETYGTNYGSVGMGS